MKLGTRTTRRKVGPDDAGRVAEVFLGADGLVYSSSVASQDFRRPLLELWQHVQEGRCPSTICQGSTVWKREALLVMAHACGGGMRIDKPEEYGLPGSSTYAELAATIDGQMKKRPGRSRCCR